jgi:hypothetical protein
VQPRPPSASARALWKTRKKTAVRRRLRSVRKRLLQVRGSPEALELIDAGAPNRGISRHVVARELIENRA